MDSAQYKATQFFIRRCMFAQEDETVKVKRFIVKHLVDKNKIGGDVGSIRIDPLATTDDVDGIINEIEQLCMADADGIGEDQKYMIQPVFSNATLGGARHIIKIQATQTSLELYSGTADEKEDKVEQKDIAAHLMRHNENIMRLNIGVPEQMLKRAHAIIISQQDQIQDLTDKINEGFEARLKVLATLEELTSKKLERELMAKQSEQKMEIMADFGNKIGLLIPTVVNKLSGKKVLPESITPKEMMFNEWMKSLTKEQFHAMLKPLTAEQQMPLLMAYQDYQNQLEIEEAKKSKEKADKEAAKNVGKKDDEPIKATATVNKESSSD